MQLLARAYLDHLEVRMSNVSIGTVQVRNDGWLGWSIEKEILTHGKNLITIRMVETAPEKAETVRVECVELDVQYAR